MRFRVASAVLAGMTALGAGVGKAQAPKTQWDGVYSEEQSKRGAALYGRTVKALSHGSKSGLMYVLNRETGQPVHPVKEMPVSTDAAPGEHPWPTQPFQFTASGKLMEPLYDTPALDIAPSQLAKGFKPVPLFTPPGPNQIRPSGGNNYGPSSYSPRTRLLYIPAIDTPTNSGRNPKGAFSAYDPTTGELKWRQKFDGYGTRLPRAACP